MAVFIYNAFLPFAVRRISGTILGLTLAAIAIAASQCARFVDTVVPRAAQFATGRVQALLLLMKAYMPT